jgi:hypothetical protein
MKRLRALILLPLLTGLLAGCGTLSVEVYATPTPDLGAVATVTNLLDLNAQLATRIATLEPTPEPLNPVSNGESIRQRMLTSHFNWDTLWADVAVIYPMGEGPAVTERYQVWIDQRQQGFRVLHGPEEQPEPQVLRVSDGVDVVELRLESGETERYALAPDAWGSFNPPNQPLENVIYPHPLAGQLNLPFADNLLPAGLAERGGVYEPVDMERVAGRQALVFDWRREAGAEVFSRYWADAETGVILREMNFGKQGGEAIQYEIVVTDIQYNQSMQPWLFVTNVSETPRYAADASGNPSLAEVEGEPPAVDASRGMLFFSVLDSDNPPDMLVRLMRVPAACLIDGSECPPAEEAIGYPNNNTDVYPLAWSPDGSLAAVGYPSAAGSPSDTGTGQEIERMGLWIMNAADMTWTPVAEDWSIRQPIWSPDGNWIAYHAQTDQNEEQIFIIRPDGSQPTCVTCAGFDGLERHFYLFGWNDADELLIYQGTPMASAVLAWNRAGGGLRTVVSDARKLQELVSLGGGQYVSTWIDETAANVVLLEGQQTRQLAMFSRASLYNLTLSPDRQWVAFTVMQDNRLAVYAIRPDGTGLRQLFYGLDVQTLAFSPDSSVLAVAGASGDSSTKVYVVDVVSGKQRLVDAPGLRLDWPWMAPSWQP